MARIFTSSYWSSSIFSLKFSTSTVVAMKLTRNSKLSIAFRAPIDSREPRFEARKTCMALSFRASETAFMSVLPESYTLSPRYRTRAVIYGSKLTTASTSMRLNAWSMAVRVPSGISRVLRMRQTVP